MTDPLAKVTEIRIDVCTCPEIGCALHRLVLDTAVTGGASLRPYVCPVCGGNGLVAQGFYAQTSGQWTSTSTAPITCRSCQGTGVVWGPAA